MSRSPRDQSPVSPPTDAAKDTPQGAPAADPPKPKRTRGPNKPKAAPPPSLITMRTEAQIDQAAIAELLSQHVAKEKGSEVAVTLVLQVWDADGNCWEDVQIGEGMPSLVRFATRGYTDNSSSK